MVPALYLHQPIFHSLSCPDIKLSLFNPQNKTSVFVSISNYHLVAGNMDALHVYFPEWPGLIEIN